MKAAALVALMLVAPVAHAADDAPVIEVPAVGGTLSVEALCLSPEEQVTLAKRLESDKAQLAAFKAAPAPLHPVVVIGLVVLGVIAGGAAGYGIARATTR